MKTINGVTITPLLTRTDDRGYLTEIIRATDPWFTGKFGQVYMVGDLKAGIIRAFHKHDALWDWFFVSHGSAKFILVDDRASSLTYNQRLEIVIGQRNLSVISVPPGVYHGWMSLEDDTQLISIASEVYNRSNPDEYRISPDAFGDVWTIKSK